MKILHQRNAGFTLIELLVVIAIIGILASVVLASLNSAREKARNASYAAQAKEYEKALALYYSTNGSYPVNSNSSWACIGINPDNTCWTNTAFSEAAAAPMRTALDPYIDTSIVPGPTDTPYGPMYRATGGGTGYELLLIFEGDVDCLMGTKTTASSYTDAGVTRCDTSS